jgi:NAD(P)-dependent dehydrogenase (short-subunit alcohol dehydrogenase family)
MSSMMQIAHAHFSYNAAKAATAHLSRMVSKEFAKTGVRVNSIVPGYFPGEMTMKKIDDKNKAKIPDEKVKDKVSGNLEALTLVAEEKLMRHKATRFQPAGPEDEEMVRQLYSSQNVAT